MSDDRPGVLAEVRWRDIVSVAGWSDEWHPELEPVECVDVGWVIEHPNHIVLVRSIHPDERISGDVAAIPRDCIDEITPLEHRRAEG